MGDRPRSKSIEPSIVNRRLSKSKLRRKTMAATTTTDWNDAKRWQGVEDTSRYYRDRIKRTSGSFRRFSSEPRAGMLNRPSSSQSSTTSSHNGGRGSCDGLEKRPWSSQSSSSGSSKVEKSLPPLPKKKSR